MKKVEEIIVAAARGSLDRWNEGNGRKENRAARYMFDRWSRIGSGRDKAVAIPKFFARSKQILFLLPR